MKVHIDTDELLDALRGGPAEHLRGKNDYLDNYADGRAAATLHISRMIGISLMLDVDQATFQAFMATGLPAVPPQEAKAA